MGLSGKIAIVTGGSGALGRFISRQLLAEGASVAIPYHSSQVNARAFAEHTARTLLVRADLTREEDVVACVEKVVGHFGTVDLLVKAAGGYSGGRNVEAVGISEWENMLATNLTSTFLMTRAVLPTMRKKKSGRIVSVAAMAALTPGAARAPYAVSKGGVVTLTEALAEELKGTGITANAIAPSIILTEANLKSMPAADSTKWVRPEEISRLVLYLCSDDARSVSGNVIKIYGGV